MRVQVVDPPAFTPPYDRALCAALATAGADVELVTSRFEYGPVAAPDGYEVAELFYRRSTRRGLASPARRGLRLAEHVPGMRRLRIHARGRSGSKKRSRSGTLSHCRWTMSAARA